MTPQKKKNIVNPGPNGSGTVFSNFTASNIAGEVTVKNFTMQNFGGPVLLVINQAYIAIDVGTSGVCTIISATLKIKRNGITLAAPLAGQSLPSGTYYPAGTSFTFPINFSVLDDQAPVGENTYTITIEISGVSYGCAGGVSGHFKAVELPLAS